jgi:hypothetical protein
MAARLLIAITAMLAISAVVIGCGGGGSSGPLTKAEFIEQGNEICAQATEERNTALKDASEEGPEGSTTEELEHYVTDVALPPIQEMTDELAELEGPKAGQKEVNAMIGEFEAGIEELEGDPSSALGKSDAFTGANEMALDYGLTDCTI